MLLIDVRRKVVAEKVLERSYSSVVLNLFMPTDRQKTRKSFTDR